MNRITSVDTLRLAAMFAVVCIHTTPFKNIDHGNELYYHLGIIINQAARFAVPFFFIISGYFWGIKIKKHDLNSEVTKNMALRILILFLFWSIIYLMPYNISAFSQDGLSGPFKYIYDNLQASLQKPWILFFQGTKVHLWFLVSLIWALFICDFFVRRNYIKLLIVLSVVLYLIGLFLKAYADTPLGYHILFDTRDGPFMSTLMFASGYLLTKYTPAKNWFYYGALLFVAGGILHFTEIYLLKIHFGTSYYQDYVFGTYFMGMGVAIASLSNHKVLSNQTFGKIGKYTLGIYAVHYMFFEILYPLDTKLTSPVWELGYPVIVFLLSIVTVILLSNIKIARRFIL